MAATKRQLNWTSVGYTPSGGSLITLTGVQSVKINGGAEFIKRSGDADRFNTTVVNHFNDPSVVVSCDDQIALLSIPVGGRGALAATHKDAKLAASGSITYALANAVPGSPDLGGDHKQIGPGSITFHSESSDGTTNPLSSSLT